MPFSFGGLYHLARNGMMARQLDMDGISNNMANIHTAGYKQTRTNFQEVLNEKCNQRNDFGMQSGRIPARVS